MGVRRLINFMKNFLGIKKILVASLFLGAIPFLAQADFLCTQDQYDDLAYDYRLKAQQKTIEQYTIDIENEQRSLLENLEELKTRAMSQSSMDAERAKLIRDSQDRQDALLLDQSQAIREYNDDVQKVYDECVALGEKAYQESLMTPPPLVEETPVESVIQPPPPPVSVEEPRPMVQVDIEPEPVNERNIEESSATATDTVDIISEDVAKNQSEKKGLFKTLWEALVTWWKS